MNENVTEVQRPKGLFNRFFILIVCMSASMGVCNQLFNSSNALHVSYLGGTAMQRALMLAAMPTAALLTRLVAGRLVELHSRRKLCMCGLSFMFVVTVAYTLVQDLNVLICLRFLQGIGFSITQTCGSVAITDLVERKRLGEGLSVYQLLIQLQSAIMPMVVVFFTDRSLFQPMYALASAMLLLALLCVTACTYEKKYPGIVSPPTTKASLTADAGSGYREDKPITKIWLFFEKRALPCMFITIVYGIGSSCAVNYVLLYAVDIGIGQAAMFFTLQTICMIAGRAVTSKSIDRYGAYNVFLPGAAAAIIAFLLLSMSNEIHALYYVAGGLYGLGYGIVNPAMNTAAVRSCPEERRSVASSTYMLSSDIGVGAGGFIWSFVIAFSGYRMMFVAAAGCYVLAVLMATYYFKVKMRGIKL